MELLPNEAKSSRPQPGIRPDSTSGEPSYERKGWVEKEKRIVASDGSVHWSPRPKTSGKLDIMSTNQPADIETTSYALLTYMLLGDTEKGLPIVRWLTSQRNSLGGFSSTQDTVLALQALGAYAEKAYSSSFNMTIKVQNGAESFQFSVNQQNSIVLQSHELSHLDDPVKIEASGTTLAFIQVQYAYNRQALRDDAAFFCSKEAKEGRSGNRFQLDLCCNYTRPGRSNMVVAEVNALSGYKFDTEEAQKLTSITDLQRVELENDDTMISLYFNPLSDEPVCLTLKSDMQYQIVDQKPAQLQLYDYYDPELQMKSTYSKQIREKTILESCSDCWPEANAQVSRHPVEASGAGARATVSSSFLSFAQAVSVLLIIGTAVAS